MTARNFSSTAADTTLTSGVTNSGTTITVAATTGFPSVPYTLAVDAGGTLQEVVLVTSVAGLTLTVTRGYDGTTAVAHDAGAVVRHSHAGIDFREANSHINSNSGHGVVTVVGTSESQTLTNKTLTGPKVDQLKDTNGGSLIVGVSAGVGAVNYVTVANGLTTSGCAVGATGSDTNVALNVTSKGSAPVQVNGVTAADVSTAQTLTNKTLGTGTKIGTGNPDASGAMQSYSPTWTATSVNPTLGNGTMVGSYMQVGKMVDFKIVITFGSTTTLGTGTYQWTYPVTPATTSGVSPVAGNLTTNATPSRFVRHLYTSAGLVTACDASGVNFGAATAAWTTGTVFMIQGRYEAA